MKNATLILFLFISLALSAQEKGATPIPNSEFRTPKSTRAVVIGISGYQHLPRLQYADRDAEVFAAWLRSPAGGNLPPENVTLLTNENATNGKMTAAIDGLVDMSQEGDQAIIYFSGHGDVETRTVRNLGFLLTYDSPANSYAAGAYHVYYLQTIMETLADKGVQTILVADACHAGKLAGSAINGTQATAQNLAKQFANEVKIMSCQPNEFSLEGAQWGGGRGAFSFHLVEGLHGLADADDDRQVSLREIGRYLEDRVAKETAPHRQLPYTVGDPYRLLAAVDAEALAALKERKQHELPVINKIETKGLEEVLLAAVDSGIQEMYGRFTAALEAGNLLEPKDSSAYDLYLKLSQVDTLKALHGLMRRNLAAAFQDDAQQAINAYMQADSSEINSLRRKDKRYFQYPLYLEKAAELLGPEHYAYNNILCKRYYFEGIVKTFEIPDFSKNDSHIHESIELLMKALEYENRAAFVYQVLGDRYSTLESDKCLEYYDKAIELAPDWVMPWKRKGDFNSWYLKQYEKAETCFQRALQLDSAYVWAYYGLGQLYHYHLKKIDEATAFYARALSLDSSHLFAPVGLSQLQAYYKKDIQGGIAILKRHQKWHPDFYMYYTQLGSFYQGAGDLEQAEKSFEKAAEFNHDNTSSISNLAWFKVRLGKNQEAEALFLKAVKMDSTDAGVWQSLGAFYRELGNIERGIACYRKALMLDSSQIWALFFMANLYAARGEYSTAIETMYKCLEHPQTSSYFNYNLGVLLNLAGRYEESAPHLEKAVKEMPLSFKLNFGPAENLLAEAWLHLGKKQAADSLFHQVLAVMADSAGISSIQGMYLYSFGRAYKGLGDIPALKNACEVMQEKYPDDSWIEYQSACLHSIAGLKEEALDWLEKAFQKGWNFYGQLLVDFDLINIRGSDEFKALLKKYFPLAPSGGRAKD